jgi:hypothetical protein
MSKNSIRIFVSVKISKFNCLQFKFEGKICWSALTTTQKIPVGICFKTSFLQSTKFPVGWNYRRQDQNKKNHYAGLSAIFICKFLKLYQFHRYWNFNFGEWKYQFKKTLWLGQQYCLPLTQPLVRLKKKLKWKTCYKLTYFSN